MVRQTGKDRGQKNTAHNNTISFVSNVQRLKKRIHHKMQKTVCHHRRIALDKKINLWVV